MITLKIKDRIKPLRKNWWNSTKKEWAPKLLQNNKEKWFKEEDPEGQPWKSLSPSYAKWKREKYGPLPILRISGKMLDTAQIAASGNKFIVSTNDIGIYHQFGTDKMPARPWMGVSIKSLDDLAEIALKNILP